MKPLSNQLVIAEREDLARGIRALLASPLLTADGGIVGFDPAKFRVDTSAFANPLNGGHFAVAQNGNGLVLEYRPVPEPASGLVLALGLGVAMLGRRRIGRHNRKSRQI